MKTPILLVAPSVVLPPQAVADRRGRYARGGAALEDAKQKADALVEHA